MEICELFQSWNKENLDLGRYEGNGEKCLLLKVIIIFSIILIILEVY